MAANAPSKPGVAASKGDAKKADPVEENMAETAPPKPAPQQVKEIGGPKGPEPTRYGDWEKGGRCSDF